MHLEPIAAEIQTALGLIAGLRLPPWGVESIEAPAALIGLPDRIDFDTTYGRGEDDIPDLPVVILVGAPEERASRKAVVAYADGTGPLSVKQKLEDYPWTSCGEIVVPSVEFDNVTYAGVPYLAAIFHLHITGGGS